LHRYAEAEEDRDYLAKQVMALKKDNAALQAAAAALDVEAADLRARRAAAAGLMSAGNVQLVRRSTTREVTEPSGGTAVAGAGAGAVGRVGGAAGESSDAKANAELARVKVLLAETQTELRSLRHAYASQLAERTDLQRLLKQCLLDVRLQIQVWCVCVLRAIMFILFLFLVLSLTP